MVPPLDGLCMADMAEGVVAAVSVYLFLLAKTRGYAGMAGEFVPWKDGIMAAFCERRFLPCR